MQAWNYDFFWSTLIGHDEFASGRATWATPSMRPAGWIAVIRSTARTKQRKIVLSFDPWEKLGAKDRGELIRRFEAHYRTSCEAHPFGVNMTGVYVTLVSRLHRPVWLDMLLLAAGTDQHASRAGERLRRLDPAIFRRTGESDVPVVMITMTSYGPTAQSSDLRGIASSSIRIPGVREPLRDARQEVLFCSAANFNLFVETSSPPFSRLVFRAVDPLEPVVEKYGRRM